MSVSSSNDTGLYPTPAPLVLPDLANLHHPLYNFAYGSNMNSTILTGRRRINPISSKPAVLFGYQLTFDLRAFPLVEPGMGNVKQQVKITKWKSPSGVTTKTEVDPLMDSASPSSSDSISEEDVHCVHGVAHELTEADFIQLLKTESGAGKSKIGYIPVLEPVITYSGEVIYAYVLCVARESPSISKLHVDPSIRYLNLLRGGAKQHGIHEKYIEYLNSLPDYQRTWYTTTIAITLALSILIFFSPIWIAIISYTYVTNQGEWSAVRVRMFPILSKIMHAIVGVGQSVVRMIKGEQPTEYKCEAFRCGTTEYDKLKRFQTIMAEEKKRKEKK